MKKIIPLLVLGCILTLGVGAPLSAYATECNPDDVSSANGGCAANEYCDATKPGTTQNGTCVAQSSFNSSAPAGAGTSGNNNDTSFVSLTNIPAITQAVSNGSLSLSIFLNNVYKICIGLAAVLAVLQLMRAGVLYMGGDSITEKKQARDLIAMSLVGLLLVLAPTIVFGIINPDILSLKIGNLDKLNIGNNVSGSLDSAASSSVIITTSSAAECTQKGGTASAGQGSTFSCALPPGSAAANTSYGQCTNYSNFSTSPQTSGCSFNATGEEGYIQINNACCSGIQSGNVCCGLPKTP